MSIYVRVGSEVIEVVFAGADVTNAAGRSRELPIPFEVLQEAVAHSIARRTLGSLLQAAEASDVRDVVDLARGDVVVIDASKQQVAKSTTHPTTAVQPSTGDVARASEFRPIASEIGRKQKLVNVLEGQMASADVRSRDEVVAGRAAGVASVERFDLASVSKATSGKFVERKPRLTFEAVRWTGENYAEFEAWMLADGVDGVRRAERVELDDRGLLVVDEEGETFRVGGETWFVESPSGELSAYNVEQFDGRFALIASDEDPKRTSLGVLWESTNELTRWRHWAALLLKADEATDELMRQKIRAVVEAPAVVSVDADDVESMIINDLVVEACARVGHEVYRTALGVSDMRSWDTALEDDKAQARAATREALSADVSKTTPAQWHAKWCAEKAADGWRHGPVIDVERKQHPNMMLPYDQLPEEQRALDQLFVVAVESTRAAIDALEVAYSVPILISGGVGTEQYEKFKQAWKAQIESSPNAWKTPIVDMNAFSTIEGVSSSVRYLVPLFEKHCECRPTNTSRFSHSHDCDTDVTDDVRTVLHRVVLAGPDADMYGQRDDHRAATDEEVRAARLRLAELLSKESK